LLLSKEERKLIKFQRREVVLDVDPQDEPKSSETDATTTFAEMQRSLKLDYLLTPDLPAASFYDKLRRGAIYSDWEIKQARKINISQDATSHIAP